MKYSLCVEQAIASALEDFDLVVEPLNKATVLSGLEIVGNAVPRTTFVQHGPNHPQLKFNRFPLESNATMPHDPDHSNDREHLFPCPRVPYLLILIHNLRPQAKDKIIIQKRKGKSAPSSLTRLLGCQVETVSVHDLSPCRHKVADELFVVVILRIHFGIGTQD